MGTLERQAVGRDRLLQPLGAGLPLAEGLNARFLTGRTHPALRGGSVCLNRIEAVAEWMPAWLCCGRKWLQWGEVCLIGRLPAKR